MGQPAFIRFFIMKIAILFTFALAAAKSRHHSCIPYGPAPETTAEIYNYLHAADEQIESMASMVEQWSAPKGLLNALSIQAEYYNMYSAMQELVDAAQYVTIDRFDSLNQAAEYQRHAGGIARMLDALSEKAEDFRAIQAQVIIRNDVLSMVAPAAAVQSLIIGKFPSDVPCDVLSTVSDACRQLTDALAHAGQIYNVEQFSFAPVPTACMPYC